MLFLEIFFYDKLCTVWSFEHRDLQWLFVPIFEVSALAWKIPWAEEPGGLQSMGSRRVGHNWATSLSLFTFMHWRRKWQPTPVFSPREPQGRGSLVGCHLWSRTGRTRPKWLSSSSSIIVAYDCLYILSLISKMTHTREILISHWRAEKLRSLWNHIASKQQS